MVEDIIANEIARTSKALEVNERQLLLLASEQQQQQTESSSAQEEEESKNDLPPPLSANDEPILVRLRRLQQESETLSLVQAIAHYVKLIGGDDDNDNTNNNDRARLCALCDILCGRTPPQSPHHLYWDLYEKEFVPLYKYLLATAMGTFRTVLKEAGYPQDSAALLRSAEHYNKDNDDDEYKEIDKEEKVVDAADHKQKDGITTTTTTIPWTGRIATAMDSIANLRALYRKTRSHVMGGDHQVYDNEEDAKINPIVVELCRPFAERMRYFFVTHPTQQDDDDEQQQQPDTPDQYRPTDQSLQVLPTNARIDRLPEWCLTYVTTNIFGEAGPWEFIWYGLGVRDTIALDFVNEILRLIQYVLAERNFFRHPIVLNHPLLLVHGIDQLLQFDHFIVTLLQPPPPNDRRTNNNKIKKKRVVVSLIDVCVVGDEELLQWWLERERDSVFHLLRSDNEVVVPPSMQPAGTTTTTTTAAVTTTMDDKNLVSPRAELFCALLRSLQEKSAVFTFSQPYLQHVAAPLCVQFLDALHLAAAELREVLTARRVPTDQALVANIRSWLEQINGAHMAVQMLLSPDESSLFALDDDMVRLGRSLERLRAAMLDDFITDVVETVLMERTKLAGYLMRCSHLLSMDAEEVDQHYMGTHVMYDMSVDLMETKRVLSIFLTVCSRPASSLAEEEETESISCFAPNLVRERVLSVLAEKFLEVALDLQGMTPDLRRPGCVVFARDVRALFDDGSSSKSFTRLLPKHPRRVMDIASLMERNDLAGLGNALCNLCGRPAPLTEAIFESDGRLYEEAMSMIRAKGHAYVELADVFAVLNRRRDL